jgi:formylglycine-generating enzyme required for sulfatase activity
MNRKMLKLTLMVAVLLMILPTLLMAQTDRVRRRPSSSGTTQQAQPKTQKTTKTTKKTQTSSRPAASSAPRRVTTSSSSSFSNQNITITANGVTFTMVAVQGGTFTMGATSEQGSDAGSRERPAHRVTLSNYYIGQTEVTQALWQAVMGRNPSKWKGSNLPVEQVSWNDCQQFITKLNQLTGRTFRLPTEAEWEYAARGGNKSRGYKYAGSNDIGSVAWYNGNSGEKTHPVGQKQANELGIYDMSGNVYEWCQDWYDNEYYSKSPSNNPCNNISASQRVYRGGCWERDAWYCRVAFRSCCVPDDSDNGLGLRLAL